jgi:hypothetical protein
MVVATSTCRQANLSPKHPGRSIARPDATYVQQLQYLCSWCLPLVPQGDAVVMVERRSGSNDAYGQGKKAPMRFRHFISHLQKGDSNLYMSTQEVRVAGTTRQMIRLGFTSSSVSACAAGNA